MTGSNFPSSVSKNQFGEVSNSFVIGGSKNIACNFIVDATNGNGLGIRSLKSSGPASNPDVSAVYMHTSATAAANNPNPAVGLVLVQFSSAYFGYAGGSFGIIPPLSGSSVNVTSGLTQFAHYVIVSVGTTTKTQWAALGLPAGVIPAVGQAFIASTASAGSGTGAVQQVASSLAGVMGVQPIGDPNSTVPYKYLLSAFVEATAIATPANGSVIALTFSMLPQSAPLI